VHHIVHAIRSICRNPVWAVLLVSIAWPLAASAACTGKLAAMQAYAGNYVGDKNLLAAPAVAARLQQLPTALRQHLERNLDVAGPIDLIDCSLVLRGNAPHQGPEENAIVSVNLYSGAVTVAIHSRGHTDIYLDQDPTAGSGYAAVPGPVRQWAVLADMGFPYQQPASVRVHVPPR